MAINLLEKAKELAIKLEYMRDIECLQEYFVKFRKTETKMMNQLVMDRVIFIISDFMNAIYDNDPFHPNFSPRRLRTFLKIIEQTLISIMIETGRMNWRNYEIFGEEAMQYLNGYQRKILLKFWRKQNCAKRPIRKSLRKWNRNTIKNMISSVMVI